MLQTLFLEHPRSVGETYLQHQRQAFSFGTTMLLGALACFVHGLIPGWCRATGSTTIERLHERIRQRQSTDIAIPQADLAKPD